MELLPWIIIISVGLYFFFKDDKKETAEKMQIKRAEEERQRKEEEKELEKKILSDENFKYNLKELEVPYRWMTLAGGTDPLLSPHIRFEETKWGGYQIVLEKMGYDLRTDNLKTYYNSSNWSERERALELFNKDLFKKYAEEMKSIVSIEWIADKLIRLKNESKYDDEFVLTYTSSAPKDAKERELLARELTQTQIFYN